MANELPFEQIPHMHPYPLKINRLKRFIAPLLLLVVLTISCLNNKSPHRDSHRPIRTETRSVQTTGYGFSSGKSKTGTVMWAKNEARLAIALQLKGNPFTLQTASGTIVFSSETDDTDLSFTRVRHEETWEAGGLWNAFIIMECKTDVEWVTGGGTGPVTLSSGGDSVITTLFTLRQQAVLNAFRKLPQSDMDNAIIGGSVYISALKAAKVKDTSHVEVSADFTVVFY